MDYCITGLALLALTSCIEPPLPSVAGCTFGPQQEVQAVSCTDAGLCLVCTERRCYSFFVTDCRSPHVSDGATERPSMER